jgi:hypothetical protein
MVMGTRKKRKKFVDGPAGALAEARMPEKQIHPSTQSKRRRQAFWSQLSKRFGLRGLSALGDVN